MSRPALFLDRDGVINVDHAYVHRREDFEFVEGIFDLVAAACRSGYLIVVVTNQAGIGRGYYSEADFHHLMDWVAEEFEQRDGRLDAVYFCPYHPDHGVGKFKRESDCRKPAPGMLVQAAREWQIDMARSLMVGDKVADMQAARAAGVGTCLLFGLTEPADVGRRIVSLTDALAFL